MKCWVALSQYTGAWEMYCGWEYLNHFDICISLNIVSFKCPEDCAHWSHVVGEIDLETGTLEILDYRR